VTSGHAAEKAAVTGTVAVHLYNVFSPSVELGTRSVCIVLPRTGIFLGASLPTGPRQQLFGGMGECRIVAARSAMIPRRMSLQSWLPALGTRFAKSF
jgi:hypothetical protein